MPNIDLHTTINQSDHRAKRSQGQGTMNTAATSIPSIKIKSNMRSKKIHSMVADDIQKKIGGGSKTRVQGSIEERADADSIISKGNETTSSQQNLKTTRNKKRKVQTTTWKDVSQQVPEKKLEMFAY